MDYKIIISSIGTAGDVFPFIGLAISLKKMGFFIDFISNDNFRYAIEAAGLNFTSNGSADEYLRSKSELLSDNRSQDRSLYYHIPAMERTFKYINSNYSKNSKVIVIVMDEHNGAAAASETLGFPLVKINIVPQTIFSLAEPPAPFCWEFKSYPNFISYFLRRFKYRHKSYVFENRNKVISSYVDNMRKANGMLPISHGKPKNQILELGFFPEWFAFRPKDWPKHIRLVGFPCWNDETTKLHPEFEKFISRHGKPILFTMGTGSSGVDLFIDKAKEICEEMQLPCVFIGGRTSCDIEISGNYMYLPYINFETALPHCLAIVHHGGIGTLAQAIKSKIPQLIIPGDFDQPDNALRIEKLGVGKLIIPQTFFEPDTVIPILSNLIENTSKGKNLETLSADIKRTNSMEKAAELIKKSIKKLHEENHDAIS